VTCGKSECQEAEFKANQERNKPKKRKLQPREGALKADGTKWTRIPGEIGMQKLEMPDGGTRMRRTPLDELPADDRRQLIKKDKLTALVNKLSAKMDEARAIIFEFTTKFAECPWTALESGSSFAAAARLKIYGMAFDAIVDTNGKPVMTRTAADGTRFNTLDNLIEYSQKEVNRRASSPARSSSPTSNLMEQQYLAAWADILEMILWS
jgi:hypothetical protein